LRSIRLGLTIRSKTREECDKNDVKLKDSSVTLKVKRRCDAERRRGYARLVVCGGQRVRAEPGMKSVDTKRVKLKNENR
jgi:hypothetical protein